MPNTVDERVVIYRPQDDPARMQNLNLFLNSAKGVGASMNDVELEGLLAADAQPVLNAVWNTVELGLFATLNLRSRPELVRLVDASKGEEASALLKLSPEAILIRWVNWQLAKTPTSKRLADFRTDFRDSEILTVAHHTSSFCFLCIYEAVIF